MRSNQIPTCYFPSTVLLLDDSRDFLLNFTLQLDDDLAFKLCHSPHEGLQTLQNPKISGKMNQRILSEYVDASGCPMTNYTVNLDISTIHCEVYNTQRFDEFSVLVVDFAMPGMSGLEFCRKLENSPIKRILLTGKADENTAVQAFNDGLIDMYIQKQNPHITELINDSIKNMQLQYFQNMSDVIVKMLSIKSPNCLQDPAFAKLFFDIVKENKIVEYYLIENSGSFLMLTADAELNYLIVKTNQDINLHYEMALDNKAPTAILEQLRKGEKIPFSWGSGSYLTQDSSNWINNLYPAKQIEGYEKYYYAFVKNALSTDIKKEKILPYHQYIDQLTF